MKNPYPVDSLDGQIWESLWCYPMLYPNGGHVLHYMYCVIGNGYEWGNGKLLKQYRDTEDREDVYENESEAEKSVSTYEDLKVMFTIDRLSRNWDIDFVRNNTEILVQDRFREWTYLYPVCEYSSLANVPDDAAKDFVAGARLAIDLSYGAIFKGGGMVRFDIGTDLVRRRSDQTEASIQVLDKSLADIIKRFGNNPRGIESNGYRLWNNFHEYVDFKMEFEKEIRGKFQKIVSKSIL